MQPAAPRHYLVKKGDTLWGIASLYLKDPWRWPDIWYANPAIKNPHLIYPGDELVLGYLPSGQPYISVKRGGQPVSAPSLPVEKLEPKIRYQPLTAAIPAVPMEAIRAFLSKTRVIDKEEMEDAGYLLRSVRGSYASAEGDEVYARGLKRATGEHYDLYRLGDKYVDPETGDTLGYQATFIGEGRVERWGDPQKLLLTATPQEAYAGDRFLPVTTEELNATFLPHPPPKALRGDIIDVLHGVAEIGQYQVVVLDRGSADGLDVGTVLGVYRRGKKISDPYAFDGLSGSVKLPDERSGVVMVFRTFKRVSYALVMRAKREIHVFDVVKNP